MPRTPTPVQGVPLEGDGNGVPTGPLHGARSSNGFLGWPSPKALVFWLGLLVAVTTAGVPLASAFFVRSTVYEVDRAAQAAVNAQVDKAVTTVTVQLGALQRQVDEARVEQRAQTQKIDDKLDRLLERRR